MSTQRDTSEGGWHAISQRRGRDAKRFRAASAFRRLGGFGIAGAFSGGNGVIGSARLSSGIAGFTLADSNRAAAVFGAGPVVGVAGGVNGSNTAPRHPVGLYFTGSDGQNLDGFGVFGESDTEVGVFGESTSGSGVNGLSATGAGHPLDPASRYLSHSFVESSEMKNFYDGFVVCDDSGEATVSLREWFESLNTERRSSGAINLGIVAALISVVLGLLTHRRR
jgi:hypothetical protein